MTQQTQRTPFKKICTILGNDHYKCTLSRFKNYRQVAIPSHATDEEISAILSAQIVEWKAVQHG